MKLKKSSIAIMMAAALFGGGTVICAASEYTFYNVLNSPVEEYVLSTAPRKATTFDYAKIRITDTNCSSGTTVFRIRNNTTGALVSNGVLSLKNSDTTKTKLAYKSEYADFKGSLKLTGQPTGAYTGFEIEGKWYPDGF